MARPSAEVVYGYGGWHVAWYRDDDNNSGMGENPRRAVWYGTRQECEQMARAEPPADVKWVGIDGWKPDMSPGSAAWCEVQGDNHD